MNLYTIARKKRTGAIIWSEDQKQYIVHQYVQEEKTLKELSLEFQVQPQAIRNLLRKMKIQITNKKIKNFPRNSNYFDIIDSSEKAYWLGILFADGTVSSKTNTIGLNLKDLEHVKKFRKAINAENNKISKVEDKRFSKQCLMYYFSIRDKKLHDALIKLGCVSNKSYVKELHMPKDIPDQFKWDFIRGYFDGDGCIAWSTSKNHYYISWVGNQYLLQDIRKICNKENISLNQNIKSKITYEFRISGQKDIKNILLNMYKNATENTSLNRKVLIVNSCLKSLGASPLNL